MICTKYGTFVIYTTLCTFSLCIGMHSLPYVHWHSVVLHTNTQTVAVFDTKRRKKNYLFNLSNKRNKKSISMPTLSIINYGWKSASARTSSLTGYLYDRIDQTTPIIKISYEKWMKWNEMRKHVFGVQILNAHTNSSKTLTYVPYWFLVPNSTNYLPRLFNI